MSEVADTVYIPVRADECVCDPATPAQRSEAPAGCLCQMTDAWWNSLTFLMKWGGECERVKTIAMLREQARTCGKKR